MPTPHSAMEQFKSAYHNIYKFLGQSFPDFDFEIEERCESVKIQGAFETRYFLDLRFKYSQNEIEMKYTQVGFMVVPEMKTYHLDTFEKKVKERLELGLRSSLEHQHIMLKKRCAKLEESVNMLLYAPGGPMYQAAEEDFEVLQELQTKQ